MQNAIELRNITKEYRRGNDSIKALDNINLDIITGEIIAISGSSGSGKSTLMNIIGCLDTATSGQYILNGRSVNSLGDNQLSDIRSKEIGFVFQNFNLISGFSALENVELPLYYRRVPKKIRHRLAVNALIKVGLGDRMFHRPFQLSGGQQQRVAIARAIALSPPIILADEPTGNLDSASGRQIIELLINLNREGKTVIIITHDNTLAVQMPRRITISDGKII